MNIIKLTENDIRNMVKEVLNEVDKKRKNGQFFTTKNPFKYPLFAKWMELVNQAGCDTIIEPFAGANNIIKLMNEAGYDNYKWSCYDIDPSTSNSVPEFTINKLDTITNFPKDSTVCITNPPYLGKVSARKRNIPYIWDEDDLYKKCLNVMLSNCDYVAAIIPESFITQGIHHDRLFGIISLPQKMFDDTECPVCLALFIPATDVKHSFDIYSNDTFIGNYDYLKSKDIQPAVTQINWNFCDPNGSIGLKCVDSTSGDSCYFMPGDNIDPSLVKVSNRTFARIGGLPDNVNTQDFIDECNRILAKYRAETKDILLTSFKSLRKDGKYRRRLSFDTARNIMDKAYINLTK